MIFTGIKRKSNQLFFNKRLQELINNSNDIPIRDVKKVIIFVDEFSVKSNIKNYLIKQLKISEDNIDVVFFQQKMSKNNDLNNVFSPKDFGWYGKVNSIELKNILTKKYDLLINYSKVENIYSNLLILQCKANLKVGFASLDNRLYELLINCKINEIDLFNTELKKYLEILKRI
tara:strand:+ start:1336 stop:1857 length:522 start_codon:yes stop_codon:yes gene_type:complete